MFHSKFKLLKFSLFYFIHGREGMNNDHKKSCKKKEQDSSKSFQNGMVLSSSAEYVVPFLNISQRLLPTWIEPFLASNRHT